MKTLIMCPRPLVRVSVERIALNTTLIVPDPIEDLDYGMTEPVFFTVLTTSPGSDHGGGRELEG